MIVLLLADLAGAHADGLLAAFDAHPSSDGVFVETSFGWLTQARSDAPFAWTCHEAITAPEALLAPHSARNAEGVWLAAVADLAQVRDAGESLYRSTTAGCDWAPPAGLTGETVVAVAFHPVDPARAVAATHTGVFTSADAGLTWSASALVAPGQATALVVVDGASWATSAGDGAWLHRGDDDGTWASHPVDLTPWPDATVRVLAATADEAWVAINTLTSDTLLHATEGGATQAAVLTVEGDLVDASVDATGAVWVTEGGRALHRATDGRTFAEVEAPLPVGLGTLENQAFLATYADLTGQLLAAGSADAGFVTLLRPQEVAGAQICAPGSDHALRCDPLWADLQVRLERYTPADPPDPVDSGASVDSGEASKPPSGCGCVAAPPAAGWWPARRR